MNKLQVKLLACMFVVMCLPLTGIGQEVDENEVVEGYLLRLNLDALVIEHLQQQLDNTIERPLRVDIARRLAKRYSKSVFSGRQNPRTEKQFSEILRLSKDFPEIASPELKMTVLHSEYANAERQFLQWLDEGRDDQKMGELAAQFQDVGGRLRRQITKLENTIFEGSDARLFAQAHYLYGWVAYYIGVLKPADRRTWMVRSDKSFREFLEIDPDKPINQFSKQWFEVQSPWHARAQIGLAMCLEALGKTEQSRFCFQILESLETDSNVRDNLDVWRLNRLVYLGEMDRALAFLRQRTASDERDVPLRTRLWVAAVDAASTCRGGRYSKTGVQFLRFGLHGLASDLNAPVLREVVQHESLNLAGEDFLLAWCRGYLSFYQGELSKSQSDFESARVELSWAVNSANSTTDSEDLAKCQFLLGWIDFQLKDYQGAAESLRQAIPELAQRDPRLAGEAQWLVVRSLQTLARADPRFSNEVFNEMDKLVRTFPNSKYVRRVEFEKLLMEVSSFPPQEALRRIKKIQRDDPNYNDAVFQQIVLQHRIWKSHLESAETKVHNALKRLQETEQMFQQLYPPPTFQQRAKSTLIVIDALIRTGGAENFSVTKSKVSQADELLRMIDASSLLTNELQYFRFQLARAEDDFSEMESVAEWFYENALNSKYSQSVLVALAQTAQKHFNTIERPEKNEVARLVEAYRQLSDLLGDDPSQLEHSQNARFSAAKLAEYQIQLGEEEKSEKLIDRLLEVFPNRKDYWLLSARVKTKLHKYEDALTGWRNVVSSTSSGTDQWYEAKLGIVRCLAASDQLAAKSLLTQTLNLAPQRPQRWEAEFEELAKELGVALDSAEGGN